MGQDGGGVGARRCHVLCSFESYQLLIGDQDLGAGR